MESAKLFPNYAYDFRGFEFVGLTLIDTDTNEQLTSLYPYSMEKLMQEFAATLRQSRPHVRVARIERQGDDFYRTLDNEVFRRRTPAPRDPVAADKPERLLVVGVLGDISAGKGETAKYLCAKHGFREIGFADELKRVANRVFRLTDAELALGKDEVVPRLGRSKRELYEVMGTEGARVLYADVWIDHVAALMLKVPHQRRWVIPDVRFENEAKWIHTFGVGGSIWRVQREGHRPPARGHVSDNTWRALEPDWIIRSAEGFDLLHRNLDEAVAGLKAAAGVK